MSRNGSREQVRCAGLELDRIERQLTTRWQSWRERLDRHRLPLLIGGGLLGGFALAAVSPRRWSRMGAALFGSGAWLARSPLGPVLVATLWTSILSSAQPPASRSGAGATRSDA